MLRRLAGGAGGAARPKGGVLTTLFTCTADVASRRTDCMPAAPGASGARADLILGRNQVRIVTTNAAYDSVAAIYSFDAAVQNLIGQQIGTTDAVTQMPDPNGVRAFVVNGFTVTNGTGTVSARNADGTDTFTAPNQPYWRYEEVIQTGQTSAAKRWEIDCPPTVLNFSFSLQVSAPVAYPNGWITVEPTSVTMAAGQTQQITATVYNAYGAVETGAAITWSSSAPQTATVSSSGLVSAVSPGQATITAAASGDRSAVTEVQVTP